MQTCTKDKKYIFSDFATSFEGLKSELDKRQIDLKKRHFIICPDKCSIFLERVLFEDSKGAFDVDILSFDRLFDRIKQINELSGDETIAKEHLSSVGAVMLIKNILAREKKLLQVFNKTSKFKGFSEQIYKTICVLSSCDIEPNDIEIKNKNNTASELKLNDIAYIYKCYKEATKNKFIDTVGKMHILYEMLLQTDLSNTSFYIVGFNRFSTIEKKILDILEEKGANYKFFNVEKPKYIFGDCDFFSCDNLHERIIAASIDIQNQVIAGSARYKDFCVLGNENIYPSLERIFTEYNIPFYIDKKTALTSTELFKFLDLSVKVSNSFIQADMIALSKNIYLNLTTAESDAFENFVLEHRINFIGFCYSFLEKVNEEQKEDGYILAAENVRVKLLEYIERFKKSFNAINTAEVFVKFIEKFFEDYNIGATTGELSIALELDLNTILGKFIECAKCLVQVIENKQKLHVLYTLYKEGLQSISLSLLPKFSDSVVVGEPDSFRGGRFNTVYSLEFEDGKIPKLVADTELIGTTDIEYLNGKKIKFEPSSQERNCYNLEEIVRLFESSKRLFLAYGSSGDERISNLSIDIIDRLEKGDKKVRYLTKNDLDSNTMFLKGESCVLRDKSNNAATIINSNTRVCNNLLPQVGEVFFKRGLVSISRVERYFLCPYKHFTESILGLVERKTGAIEPTDIGIFLHKAAEEFVKIGDYNNPEKVMREIASELLKTEYKLLLKRNEYMAKRILEESVTLSKAIANSFLAGSFYNDGVEVKFGKHYRDEKTHLILEGLVFRVNEKEVMLEGKIDRVDVFKDANSNVKFARVIDYKTGKADFIYNDLYYGTKLQLPLYAKVLEKTGYQTAGFFYFLLSHGFGDADDKPRLLGVYRSDDLVTNAFDIALTEPGYKSTIIKAKRNTKSPYAISGTYAKSCRSAYDIGVILDYSTKVLQKALVEIALGYIAPSPNSKSGSGACNYCKYGAMCGIENNSNLKREQVNLTHKNFFEIIEGVNN